MLDWESSGRQLEGFSAQFVPADQRGQGSLGRLAGDGIRVFLNHFCLCSFFSILLGISVTVHPLLKHLMVDKVISGHETLCVSDNTF